MKEESQESKTESNGNDRESPNAPDKAEIPQVSSHSPSPSPVPLKEEDDDVLFKAKPKQAHHK